MKKGYKISVIIPTYNRPEDLKNCLRSLEKQTMKPDEIIIIDDNSNIPLLKTINKFKENKKLNIKYYKNKINKKQSYSKNRGAKLANGDILAFLDDDCIANENWIKNAKKSFLEKDVEIIAGKINNLEGRNKYLQGLVLLIKYFPSFILNPRNFFNTGRILPSGFVTRNFERNTPQLIDWGSAGNLFIKKDVFNKLGKFPEFLGGHVSFEEPFLFINNNKKVFYEPEIEVFHNFSKKGRLKREPEKEFDNYLIFFKEFLGERPPFSFIIQSGWLKIYQGFIKVIEMKF